MEALLAILLLPGVFALFMMFWCIFDLIFAVPFMWAWNYIVPVLFHGPEIGYGQAFCILFLLGFLKSASPLSNGKS